MKDYELKIGSVVKSLKGRDSGFCFMVVEIQGDFAYIADGGKHMLTKLKKKNQKHLSQVGEVLTGIAEKLKTNKKVFDSEVRSALRKFNDPSVIEEKK